MTLHEELTKIFRQRGAYDVGFPDGWAPLLNKLHNGLSALDPDYRLSQVKVKFGGLRFYPSSLMTGEMYGYIRRAEAEAGQTCETCGGPGVARKGFWTLCDEHAEGRKPVGSGD